MTATIRGPRVWRLEVLQLAESVAQTVVRRLDQLAELGVQPGIVVTGCELDGGVQRLVSLQSLVAQPAVLLTLSPCDGGEYSIEILDPKCRDLGVRIAFLMWQQFCSSYLEVVNNSGTSLHLRVTWGSRASTSRMQTRCKQMRGTVYSTPTEATMLYGSRLV